MGRRDEGLQQEPVSATREKQRRLPEPFGGAVELALRAAGLTGLRRDMNDSARVNDGGTTYRKSRLRFAGSMINSISCVVQ